MKFYRIYLYFFIVAFSSFQTACLRETIPGTTPIEQPPGTAVLGELKVTTAHSGKIAFSYNSEQLNQVFIMNADGSNRYPILSSIRPVYVHGFSLDGQFILTSEDDSTRVFSGSTKTFYLGKYNSPTGKYENEVITLPSHASSLIKWLPDHSGFIYTDQNNELYEFRLKNGSNRKILANEKVINFEISPFPLNSTNGIRIAVITEKKPMASPPATNRSLHQLYLVNLDNLQARNLIQTTEPRIQQVQWGLQVSNSLLPNSAVNTQNSEQVLYVVGSGLDPQEFNTEQTLYKIRIDQNSQARSFLRNNSKILHARVTNDSRKISILAVATPNPNTPVHFFQTVDFDGRILFEFKRQEFSEALEKTDAQWIDDSGNTLIFTERDHVFSIQSTGQNQLRLF